MAIDDTVNEETEKKRFVLDTIFDSGVSVGGAAVGATIGSALGPIGTVVGAVVGDILGHIIGFSIPWYIQHRDRGIYQNIKDLAGIHTRKILPYIGHLFIGGPLAYLGTMYTGLSPALIGAGAAIGAEVGYVGLSYLANLGRLEKGYANHSPSPVPS
ncbi:MAG: hypothetical protein U9O94_08145 [Nanoarchaeota archaeon]|nr:hypothetical protein [Nanoarchaeota archaeon]